LLIWVPVLCGVVTLESLVGRPVRDAWGGRGLSDVIAFAIFAPFFWWTMHFMLGGRVPWRRMLPSAIITGVLWVGLGVVSELYFSSTIITDSRTFGAIGAVFSLLTWLIAIGFVVIIGALAGVVVVDRRGPRGPDAPADQDASL
jgi:membrane protein